MITRVRLEACGPSAARVEKALVLAAQAIDGQLHLQALMDGESVIERQVEEPFGGDFAWRGRLVLHANVAEDAKQRGLYDDGNFRVDRATPGIAVTG
jgi:hypothetical protein